MGKQDVVFAGGGEELHWSTSVLFDAMGAMSSRYNETPQAASRTYDADRDGFVISGGGGVLVLESLDHALGRGAPILAELVGYGASSDGYDMVQPSGEGAIHDGGWRVGAHAAGVRPFVAVVNGLVVLSSDQGNGPRAIDKGEKTCLFAGHEFLNHDFLSRATE